MTELDEEQEKATQGINLYGKFKFPVEIYSTYRGMSYGVRSEGSFPCGYVGVPREFTDIYQERYDCPALCKIATHQGITYAGRSGEFPELSLWWVGWDYGHTDDYKFQGAAFQELNEKLDLLLEIDRKERPLKIWTVKEIIKDCKSVIDQLLQKEEDNGSLP